MYSGARCLFFFFRVVQIKAYSFQGFDISYFLFSDTHAQSNEFAIDRDTGMVDLLRQLDYERDPDQYYLTVKAVENGRPQRTSTVRVSDVTNFHCLVAAVANYMCIFFT